MQWTALYLPRLPLESFLRASPTADPWAMAENRHVLDCNTAAFALGVRPRMARAAAAAAPDRVVWGTDWPHPMGKQLMPNDGDLVNMLADWVPDEAQRKKVLVDNPARLYHF